MDSQSGPTAARVFNDLLLSYCVFTLDKLQLFGVLKQGVTLDEMVHQHKLDPARTAQLLRHTSEMGVTTLSSNQYGLTRYGHDLARHAGFFTWAIGGYSPLLENMDEFLLRPDQSWRPFVRGHYVAIGADACHTHVMEPVVDAVLAELPGKRIADLGCGNAGRLIRFLSKEPDREGIGIDIDAGAIQAAGAHIAQYGLTHRIKLIQQNVLEVLVNPDPDLAQVELVVSFMMLHDLFNMNDLEGRLFDRLRTAFPKAHYYALADTCLSENHKLEIPVFIGGYELVHSMRGIKNFPLSYYEQRFKTEGCRLLARHDLHVPNTYLFVLEV